jgi:hypothetical protein
MSVTKGTRQFSIVICLRARERGEVLVDPEVKHGHEKRAVL